MISNFRKTFASCFAAAYLIPLVFLSGLLAPAITAPRGHGVSRKAVRDTERRVLVNFHLNGQAPLSQVRDRITAAGGNIIAENNKYKNGVLSAFVPVNKLVELAQ